MNSRLIPPSHFDPNARDSLEASRSPSPAQAAEMSGMTLQQPFQYRGAPSEPSRNVFLRPPDDFSPGSGYGHEYVSAPQPASGKIHPRSRSEFAAPLPGQYETPPHVNRNQCLPVPVMPSGVGYDSSGPSVSEKYSDLLRLQAENQALKTLIQCKKIEADKSSRNDDEAGTGSNMRSAIIEHLTTHIARLQHELEEKSLLIAKRENDTTQLKAQIENKDKENESISDEMTRLQNTIKAKEDKAKLQEQEIEALQKIVRDLRREKDELSEIHNRDVKVLNTNLMEEKEKSQTQLRRGMEDVEKEHEKEMSECQEMIKNLEIQNKEKLAELEENHDKELKSLRANMDKKLQLSEEHANIIAKELKESKEETERVSEVLTKEKSRSVELQNTINILQGEIASATELSEKYLAQTTQLQTYIGKQQEEDYERSQWINHKKKFEDHILELQGEKETLNKTLELQNIRLQSITKILTTQEEAIQANAKAFSTENVRGNPEHVVMRKWREKVFELMIQCKSRELSLKELENKCKLAKVELKDQLEEEKRVCIILESQLSECRAQLEMQQNENTSLSETNNRIIEKLNSAAMKCSQLEETVVTISESVGKTAADLSHHFHSNFTAMVEKNIHMEQRIVFANNRLRTIQDLMARRDNVWKAKLRRAREGEPLPPQSSPKVGQKPKDCPELLSEIEKLTKERDTLSQRLNTDSSVFENAMSKLRNREDELEKNVSLLQHDVQQKSEEIAQLQIRIEDYDDKVKCHERAAIDAKENAQKVLEDHEKAIETKLNEAWERWDAEKRELETRLNDSQRELAKTVVTSRQSERNSVRERKRAEEELKVRHSEHHKEVERLRHKIKTLQQDNNLLMTTLRQQGLISAFKAARSQASKMRKDLDTITSNILSQNGGSAPGSGSGETSPQKNDIMHCTRKESSSCPMSDVTMRYSKDPLDVEFFHRSEPDAPHSQTDCVDGGNASDDGVAEMLKDLVVLTEDILKDSD